jgi:hypothetical protein
MELLALLLKYVLIIFSGAGIVYHLLILRNPMEGDKLEKTLGKEYGVKARIVPRLEENKMEFHERMVRSRNYNVLVVVFLILLMILLTQ